MNHGQRQHQQQQRQQESSHRRTESYSADSTRNSLPVPSSIPPPLVSPPVQSPRERSRIRTNPWLSANSSGSSTNGLKSRLALDESSSSSGLKLTESSGSASDVNLNGREPHGRREHRQESLSAGRSPWVIFVNIFFNKMISNRCATFYWKKFNRKNLITRFRWLLINQLPNHELANLQTDEY